MVPFDRWLQRMNAVGCAGFVIVVLMQVLGWAARSQGPRAPFTLGNVLAAFPALTVRAASRSTSEDLSMEAANRGLVQAEWTARTPVNRFTLDPAPTVWPSESDARLAAAHERYLAWFREYSRRTSPSSMEPAEASAKGAVAGFSPVSQYAYASNCSAPMSEVAELAQHR